ncbi:phosphonate C-P lyase system protein PhnG [Dongia mobilis]|uniref:phosphonate C-P lyase system protein PhnG n=1 Tax=Dongia sp. TaxID=1977262 RepID=UPI0026F26B81
MSGSGIRDDDVGHGRDGSPLSPVQAARRRWLVVLARASLAELEVIRGTIDGIIGDQMTPHVLRQPEIGMAMLRGRMGGTGQVFNFSEITLTRCTLQLADGRLGCAYMTGRRKNEARLAALIDALLQDPEHGETLIALTIDPLAAEQAERARRLVARSVPTKVEFFTLVRGENPA